MSSGGAVLLPLHALGGNVTYAGRSGVSNVLHEIEATGSSYVHHPNCAITLPSPLTVTFTVELGATAAATISLPRLSASGRGGLNFALDLPRLTVAGTASIPLW